MDAAGLEAVREAYGEGSPTFVTVRGFVRDAVTSDFCSMLATVDLNAWLEGWFDDEGGA